MTKKISFFTLIFTSSLFALQIELVEDTSKPKDPNNNFFMKDERKVYRAMEPNIIKAMEPTIIKAMDIKVVKSFEVEGVPVAPTKKTTKQTQASTTPPAKKEDIKKQFATKEQLKVDESAKDTINVSDETADFFETINSEDSTPVDME